MLDKMRRHAGSWIIKAVLWLLIAVFIFWGVGTGLFSQVHPVATVDGKRILPDELQRETDQLRRTLQHIYGQNAAELFRNINLRQRALENIIEERLVAQEARRLGINVSRAALQKRIASQRAFQIDGQFDFRQYEAVLRDNNMAPSDYEAEMRAALTQQALQQMLDQGVQVSEGEVRQAYDLKNEKLSLAYVVVSHASFTARISPTEKQLEAFYNQHRELFREPERVKISYIHYDPMALSAKTPPTEKEVEEYYRRNLKTRFTHPDEARASHILIRVPSGAGAPEEAVAKAKAEAILAKLKSGADFAKLARKYSEDPGTQLKGGDLGTFARGTMVKPFEDAVFSMKPGEVRVVETQFGFHVVKLDAFIPAHTDKFAQVKDKIIETLRQQSGTRIAREALDQDVAAALAGDSLEEIAKKRGLEVVNTPAFSRADATAVMQNPRIAEAAFKLDVGQVRAVTGGGAPYLVKLVSRDPSRIPPFKDIEAKVREASVNATAVSDALAQARKLLDQIKDPKDFDQVARANKLTVHTTEPFERSDRSVPGIGYLPEVADAAATLPKVPGVIGRVIENKGDAYLFEVLARTAPTEDQWKGDQASFTQQFLRQRRAEAWSQFVNALKSRARITVDTNQLGTQAPPST
jgi:peptidyl-prolyl cis-trans isomerase D